MKISRKKIEAGVYEIGFLDDGIINGTRCTCKILAILEKGGWHLYTNLNDARAKIYPSYSGFCTLKCAEFWAEWWT